MDKKTLGLVGVISALTPLAAAAAPSEKTLAEVMAPQSYAELLQPIPNASALLKEEAASSRAQTESRIRTAQYYGYPDGPYYHHHHHHHHHHHQYRGWDGYPYYRHHHHHHHHHHHNDYWGPY